MNVGLLGAGHIADQYVEGIAPFDDVDLIAFADTDEGVRARRAATWGIAGLSPEELLADPRVELVVNLTPPRRHAATTRAALRAGKHVYSEKPLAVTVQEGRELVDEAARSGLTVACAPDTLLGSAFETAAAAIEAGLIGRPLAAHAFVTGSGPESWHPAPQAYYEVGAGPLFSLGPYYVSALVRLLGRIDEAIGLSVRPHLERAPSSGAPFAATVDTTYAGALRFASGPIASLFASYDVVATGVPPLEVHGDEGTLCLADPNVFDGRVVVTNRDGAREELEVAGTTGYGRGVGVADQAAAIAAGRPPRAGGELALHVLDAISALAEGGRALATDPCLAPA